MSVQANTTHFPSASTEFNLTEPRMPIHPQLPGLFNPNLQQSQCPYIWHPLVNPGMPNANMSPYAGQRLGSNTAGIPSPPNPKNNNLAGHMPNHFTPPLAYHTPTQQAIVPNGFVPSVPGFQPYINMVNGVVTYLPSSPITPEQAENAARSQPTSVTPHPHPQPQVTPLPSQPVTNVLSDTPCPMASSKKRKRPDTPSDETSEELLEPEDDKERKRRYKNAMAARAATRKKTQQSELNKRRITICISEIAIVKSHASIMIALLMAKGCDVIPPSPPPV